MSYVLEVSVGGSKILNGELPIVILCKLKDRNFDVVKDMRVIRISTTDGKICVEV